VQSAADLYFVPAIIGVIVAIIIVGAVLALLMLRKRP
jgi:flagellar biosynthesis protein FliQ